MENCNFYGQPGIPVRTAEQDESETYDTTWDSSNDYSYGDLISFEDDNDAAAITKKIPAYANGELVWGEEPDGTTPSDTTETKPSETTTTMQSTTTTTVTSASVSGSGSDTGTADVLYGDTNPGRQSGLTDAVR